MKAANLRPHYRVRSIRCGNTAKTGLMYAADSIK
jgi:hypothetical protein